MIRRIITGLILCTLVLSVFLVPQRSTQAATTAAATPRLIAEVNGPGKGRVWVGSVPAGSSSKPVLVFVHGLHGKAPNWWGETVYYGTNDMYQKAYASGYRTAFVSPDDEVDGPASTMWDNGYTISRQLDVILNYYGVSSVNIIAHSKGGVDTNSALVHYGASPKIQRIVTLSSPHHGSQLADLAYSWWAGWLASLLGQRDDGTYTMQTSYMSYFRSITDNRSENNNVRFYTTGGKHHGPFLSAMWWGGAYLPGDNDGVVTVNSSYHPLQTSRLFTSSSLNHDNIRIGRDVWTRIEPTVRTTFRRDDSNGKGDVEVGTVALNPTVALNTILRGGELVNGTANARFPLESTIDHVSFNMMGSNPDLQVTFVGPQGQRIAAEAPVAADAVFDGAWYYMAAVKAPTAGEWQVEVNGKAGAYLLVASIEGGAHVELNQVQTVRPHEMVSLQVTATDAQRTLVQGQLTGTPMGQERAADLATQQSINAVGREHTRTRVAMPGTVGLYQLGLTITGTTSDGTAFERSVATNLSVLTGKEGINALPAGR